MKDTMTAEEVLAVVDAYCKPPLAEAMRSVFQRDGVLPGVVMRDMNLEKVTLYRRKGPAKTERMQALLDGEATWTTPTNPEDDGA